MAKTKILVVEDEGIIAEDIKRSLKDLGYSVSAVVASGEEALEKVEENKPDLILMDIILQGKMDGIEAASQIRSRFNIPIVYLTAYADVKTLERAKVTDPFGYIIKPFEDRELHVTVEMALRKHLLETRLKESEEWLSTTLKSIGDAVIATDADSLVTFINPVAQSLTGWKEKDGVGKPLKDVFNIINEFTRAPAENPVTRVIREGVVVGLANHTVLIAKDGTETPIADSAAPIKDDKGDIVGVVLVFRDVTEHRRAERMVQEAREYAESIVHTVREPLIVLDAELRVISANRSFYQTFQVKEEEIENKYVYDLSDREWGDIPKLRELLEEIIPKNTSFENFEMEHDFPAIGHKTLLLNARRIYKETNRTRMILLAIEDITERKQAEEAVRESEAKFRNIIQSSPMGMHMYQLKKDGRLVFIEANPAADKILGVDNSQFIGKTIEEAFPPLVETEVPERYRKAAAEGKSWYTEQIDYEYGQISGVFEVHAFQTSPGKMVAMFIDITERKETEEALRESEEKYRTLIESSTDCICHIDLEGKIIYMNPGGVRLNELGSSKDACGRDCALAVKEEYKDLTKDALEGAKKGEVVNLEYESTTAKGKDKWWESIVGPIKDKKGNVKSLVRISRDVTERKRLEVELKDRVEELELTNKLKDVFTDILRHDLLNPLSIIKNAAELMTDRDLLPDEKIELDMIQNNVLKLETMIDDATTYAKLESTDKLDFEKADLSEIAEDAIRRVENLANEKGIEIVNKMDGKKHFALVNPFIEDVFTNILSNAIKYSPEKSKVIIDLKSDKKEWNITVKDFGDGIPDEYKETIFNRFERLNKSGIKGAGLGLAIAKRIVKLHNGKIWAEDNPEGGSIFYINLPKA